MGARVLGTLAVLSHRPVPFLPQRASCSLGTTLPTSATFQATSCAATGGASPAPGSATDCPTASTRVTRRSAVSGPALCWGCGRGAIPGCPWGVPPGLCCPSRGSGLWTGCPACSTCISLSEQRGQCRSRGLGVVGATALGEQGTFSPDSPHPYPGVLSLPSPHMGC